MADLPIIQGADERFSIVFTDGSNQPENLSGQTITLESDGVPIPATVTILDALTGSAELYIAGIVTSGVERKERVRFVHHLSNGDNRPDDWFWLTPGGQSGGVVSIGAVSISGSASYFVTISRMGSQGIPGPPGPATPFDIFTLPTAP